MKTFLQPAKQLCIGMTVLFAGIFNPANSQSSAELVFRNSTLLSGTAFQNGAKYLFPGVTSGVDAVLTIVGRSDANVVINNIDITSTGFDKAFQPQLGKTGNVPANSNWWVDFDITFYDAPYSATSNKRLLESIMATGLDIDGNNVTLREYTRMNEITIFNLSANTALTPTLIATLPLNFYSGKPEFNYQFMGILPDHPGIDTNDVSIMATYHYEYKQSVSFRMGGVTAASSVSSPARLYSLWFRQFSLSTLPLKILSFSAILNNNKADLHWTTAGEINVSHFVVEKSFDGIHFNDAGIVFAYGNTADETGYRFSDNLAAVQSGIVYYRLCAVDNDGKIQYSDVRLIRISKQPGHKISIVVFPNPVRNELRVTIPSQWQNKKVIYELYYANGQASKKTENSSSNQTEIINLNNLTPGFYMIRVSCEGQSAQQVVVKQ